MPAFSKGGSRQADFGGSILAITKTSKHPTAAWDFIHYSLYSNAGEKVMLKYGLFPSWKPFYKTHAFNATSSYFGIPLYRFFAKESTHIAPMRYGSRFWNFAQPLTKAYEAVLHGTSPKVALQNATTAVRKLKG